MHLISALVAGIRGAENGTAVLYARGTTVRAVHYSDFEATQQSTNDLLLDANGAVEVYVNQLVDVLVTDLNGVVTRSFTAGSEAPAVEVISRSFTGTDYVSGASGASKPTTLQAILDLWKTNGGTTDWKVLIGGVATTLSVALGAFTGLFFNVKSPAYGATGNGSTDDTSAVQAAAAAAIAAGGGVVFFPAGTYRLTAAVNVTTKVMLLGAGAAVSKLKRDSAAAHCIAWSSATANEWTQISELGFTDAQASTGYFVNQNTANANCRIDACTFDGNGLGGAFMLNTVAVASLMVSRSLFLPAVSQPIVNSGAAGLMFFLACKTKLQAGAYNTIAFNMGNGGVMAACEFDATQMNAGACTSVLMFGASSQLAALIGCSFNAAGAGTQVISLTNAIEVANCFDDTVALSVSDSASTSFTQLGLSSFERCYRRRTISTAAHTMPSNVGTEIITYTFAGDCTFTTPAFAPGRRGRFYLHNSNGSNRAVTFAFGAGVTFISPNASITFNTTTYSQVDWEFMFMNGKACFRYVVTDANRTQPV